MTEDHFRLQVVTFVLLFNLFDPWIIIFATRYIFNTHYLNPQLRLYSQRYNSCRPKFLRFLSITYSLKKMEITIYDEFDLICSVWLGQNFVSLIFCIFRKFYRDQ